MARKRLLVGSRWLLILLSLAVLSGCALPGREFQPQAGDLLFQDLDGSPLCDAIERVTQGVCGGKFSHVGIVGRPANGQATVIEASGAGVRVVPLEAFLGRSRDARGRPKTIVGRLLPRYQRLIAAALGAAERLLGKPYDKVFAVGNDAYYCSELVYEAFRAANGGQPLFGLAPMTFRDPDSGVTLPAWEDYFRTLGVAIPEGEPGINPGGISRSPSLRIVHAYGTPSGW